MFNGYLFLYCYDTEISVTILLLISGCESYWLYNLKQKYVDLAPVVQKVDNAIHRINHYPVDSAISFPNIYPLDSDLSGG